MYILSHPGKESSPPLNLRQICRKFAAVYRRFWNISEIIMVKANHGAVFKIPGLWRDAVMKKKKIRWLFIAIPVVLIAGAAGWYFLKGSKVQAASGEVIQRTAVVRRGTLKVTLSGSGSVYPAVSTDIKVNVEGTIKENYLKEGKAVKAGEVLLVLNKYDYDISNKKLQNTLEQKELAYRQQLKKNEALTVKAPISGKITELFVAADDEVNTGTKLLTITDTSALTAEVSFKNTSAQSILTQQVMLHIPDYMTTVSADIISIQQNADDVDIKLLVKNPGSLQEGISVWCEAESFEKTLSSTTGTLKWYNQKTVYAQASGIVQNLNIELNQIVSEGMTLITLYNEEAEINLRNALLQVEEAKYNIEQSRIDTDQYTITAPMDGYIISVKELLVGDSLKKGDVVCSFINTDEMKFDISIDELDINKVKEGQPVIVTTEAIESTKDDPITGKVSNIALKGTTSNGVTSYPVTISIPGRSELKVGMNVDAEIQVVNKENTLLLPLEALQKVGGSYMVWLKTMDDSRAGRAYTGETGRFTAATNTGETDRSAAATNAGKTDRPLPSNNRRFGNAAGEAGEALRRNIGSQAESGAAPNSRGSAVRQQIRPGEDNYYQGAILVPVETGLYNENYIEIVSGLKEGDIVILPQQSAGTAAPAFEGNRQMGGFRMPMGGFGGMGGGGFSIPGGGRP